MKHYIYLGGPILFTSFLQNRPQDCLSGVVGADKLGGLGKTLMRRQVLVACILGKFNIASCNSVP